MLNDIQLEDWAAIGTLVGGVIAALLSGVLIVWRTLRSDIEAPTRIIPKVAVITPELVEDVSALRKSIERIAVLETSANKTIDEIQDIMTTLNRIERRAERISELVHALDKAVAQIDLRRR